MYFVSTSLISVVIQGPLYRKHRPGRGIDVCIASIRHYLPGAEVVVSTWAEENTAGLDADQLVISADPGSILDCSGNVINTNRQLVSTLAGIKAATRPYVMKFRADLNMTAATFARMGTFQDDSAFGQHRLFMEPITMTTLFIRNPAWFPMLYHISDLVQFGRREDMLRLWDQPVFAEDDLCLPQPRRNPFGNYQGFSRVRMNAEQALMIGMLRKCGFQIELDYPCQVKTADLEQWESILSHNFHVLDYENAGIDFPERLVRAVISPRTIFSAKAVREITRHAPLQRRLRRVRVWLNQYVLCYLQLAWWVPAASTILFSISPPLAKRVRRLWQKIRGNKRPSQDDLGAV